MDKLYAIAPMFLQLEEHMPNNLENGILYISRHWKVAIHLCACGCGGKSVTPLKDGKWTLTNEDNEVSLQPSIGNWSGEDVYHAHYFITKNKIIWC